MTKNHSHADVPILDYRTYVSGSIYYTAPSFYVYYVQNLKSIPKKYSPEKIAQPYATATNVRR